MLRVSYMWTALVAGLLLGGALTSEGQQTPEGSADANTAKNLARLNCGAYIVRILPGGKISSFGGDPNTKEDPFALLLDDSTLSCPLVPGDNVFIVSLPRISVLQRFAFLNRNGTAQGNFEIAVSNYRLGSPDQGWNTVRTATSFDTQSVVNMPLAGVEAKYVRLSFHVTKEGSLGALSLYGIPTLEGYARGHTLRAQTAYSVGAVSLTTQLKETLNFNYANEYARGRVVYVSSGGSTPSRMIDDDVSTSFVFDPSDAHPTVIIALADRQNLQRVSTTYEMKQGLVEIFLLDELGTSRGDLGKGRLIATLVNQQKEGDAAVNFTPCHARYVALRWSPKSPQERVTVAEVAAFGAAPIAVLDLGEQPQSLSEITRPGESGPDFSNSLGTLASPPTVSATSP
jgi:hypothetical protein